jgi:hypothetical protein
MLLSLYFFILTPVTNTISHMMEYEADMYGLNAAQQPDGEANVDTLLGEYRKLDPGPVEEFIFFDHPSGRTRITAALRWKGEHPDRFSMQSKFGHSVYWRSVEGGSWLAECKESGFAFGAVGPGTRVRVVVGSPTSAAEAGIRVPDRSRLVIIFVRRGCNI